MPAAADADTAAVVVDPRRITDCRRGSIGKTKQEESPNAFLYKKVRLLYTCYICTW